MWSGTPCVGQDILADTETRYREYDELFGKGRWRIAWQLNERQGGAGEAAMVYEDAYFKFLASSPDLVDILAREARDVYDDQESNVLSGLDYACQVSRTSRFGGPSFDLGWLSEERG